jgi:uncharacterized membrane protein (UPF0127 family)
MRGRLGKAPITFVLLATLLATAAACERGRRVAIVAPDGSTLATVKIELADTPQSREMGLMYRDALAGDAGMLFVFAEPSHQVFWMKNTRIPLDLLFADSQQRVIGIVANAEPYSEARIGVPGDSQYVLEVNGGFCQQHAVKAGDRLEFLGFSPSVSD